MVTRRRRRTPKRTVDPARLIDGRPKPPPTPRPRRPGLLPWTPDRVILAGAVIGALTLIALLQPWQMLRGNPDLSGRLTVDTTGRIVAGCTGSSRKTAACVSHVRYRDQAGVEHTVRVLLGPVEDPAAIPMRYDRERPGVAAPRGLANAGTLLRTVDAVLSIMLGSLSGTPLGAGLAYLLTRIPHPRRTRD